MCNTITATDAGSIRLGRISYANVLPIYLPLETGRIPHRYQFVSGPPAALNEIMSAGGLDVASVSSIEYARRPERYLLIPDLAIGCRGPVRSVLLLSRVPVEELGGATVLVSSQTHTSAALLRILFREHLRLDVRYEAGEACQGMLSGEGPEAVLAIGDEALFLRDHPGYPHALDLGEAWRQWTGLPFIFGVWVVSREAAARMGKHGDWLWRPLLEGKRWGQAHMDQVIAAADTISHLGSEALACYFQGLVYDLGQEERQGLEAFFAWLVQQGEISRAPELTFVA